MIVIDTNNNFEFITSDMPVIEIPRDLIKSICIDYPNDLEDYPLYVCTVSPSKAIIVYHKDDYVSKQLIESGYFTDKHCNVINSITIGEAVEIICSCHELESLHIEAFKDPNHPRMYVADELKKTKSKAPKRIRPKFLQSSDEHESE